jgi:hypothetical protein
MRGSKTVKRLMHSQMRLHLPAIPHTITSPEFSHCAFTGKVLRFAPMMRSRGYEVIHYGVEGSGWGRRSSSLGRNGSSFAWSRIASLYPIGR